MQTEARTLTPAPGPPLVVAPGAPIASDVQRPLLGVLCCVAGLFVFSAQDVIIKILSGTYPVWELAFIRSCVILGAFLAFFVVRRSVSLLRTKRLGLHLLRGSLAMTSYTCYYLAISSMPLADAAAIYAAAPLFMIALSVPILHEKVGPRRWAAVLIGFFGVLIMLRPGAGVFQGTGLFALLSAACYGCSAMVTRKMAPTESAAQMAMFSNFVYFAASLAAGVGLGHLDFVPSGEAGRDFLLRPWSVPPIGDLALMIGAGIVAAFGFLLLAQAYRAAPVSTVAPFEFTYLISAIVLGYLVFGTLPGVTTTLGALIVVGSGIYVIRREAALAEEARQEREAS